MYAESETELSDKLEELYANPVCIKYRQYQKHLIVDTFPKIAAWSLSHRISNNLPTSNNNTNNLVETSFRYTKEDQFNRHKAYNLTDLLAILLDESEFYCNKFVDAANNRLQSWLKNCHSRYITKLPSIDPDKIVHVGGHTYLVPSESDTDITYLVDMDMRLCSCPMGQLRGPCKHKYLVSVSKIVPSFDVLPTQHPAMRQQFMFIGTGENMDIDWFLPMQCESLNTEHPCPQDSDDVQHSYQDNDDQDNAPVPGNDNSQLVQVQAISPDIVSTKLATVMKKLHDKIAARISHDPTGYDKALAVLDRTVDRLPATVDTALQKVLYSFGKSVTQV